MVPYQLLKVVRAGVLVAAALSPLSNVAADTGSLFTVSDVRVDVTADAANIARSLALAEGQRLALERLLQRITPRSDYVRHPVVDDSKVAMLVQDISISDERVSSIRYIAKLLIRFKKEEVRRLLKLAKIPHTETRSKPLLVLPVYETGGALLLWDEPNRWRQVWFSYPADDDSLVPLVFPVGDLSDVASIGAEQALRGDRDRLKAITHRYGLEDALVAHATLVRDLSNNVSSLHIDIRRFGPSGESFHKESVFGDSNDNIGTLLSKGIEQVRERIEERWKLDTLLTVGSSQRLSARVPLENLGDWLKVRQRLKATGNVSNMSLVAISRNDARVIIDYVGGKDQLVLSLAQRDLELRKSEGFWIITLRNTITEYGE